VTKTRKRRSNEWPLSPGFSPWAPGTPLASPDGASTPGQLLDEASVLVFAWPHRDRFSRAEWLRRLQRADEPDARRGQLRLRTLIFTSPTVTLSMPRARMCFTSGQCNNRSGISLANVFDHNPTVIETAAVESIRRDLAASGASDTPSVRAVRRRWTRWLEREPSDHVLTIARELAHTGSWRERLIAYELLRHHEQAFRNLDDAFVESLTSGLSDWGVVDLFAVTVAGPAWRAGTVSDATVRGWAKSPNRWRRRLALVSTIALNSRARRGSGDARRTFAVCNRVLDDRDDTVVKALSWALRELAKREPAAVRIFLRRERSRLASRVIREVSNKLELGVKRRPRRRDEE
jgi:3-methyladenine DNA glycosylase AlkD